VPSAPGVETLPVPAEEFDLPPRIVSSLTGIPNRDSSLSRPPSLGSMIGHGRRDLNHAPMGSDSYRAFTSGLPTIRQSDWIYLLAMAGLA
jgi:hypothetical protein